MKKGSLSYDTSTNYFLWEEDVNSLRNLMSKILNDVSVASADVNEDKHHKMQSFKTSDCTIKFYSTTKKVIIQGSGSEGMSKALSAYLIKDGERKSSSIVNEDGEGELTEDLGRSQ